MWRRHQLQTTLTQANYPVVGCWAHATHVVQELSVAQQTATTMGMYTWRGHGVDHSVDRHKGSPWSPCAFLPATIAAWAMRGDYVYGAVISGSHCAPNIPFLREQSVNLASTQTARRETNRAKFLQLSQPAQGFWRYFTRRWLLPASIQARSSRSGGNDRMFTQSIKAYRTSATALSTSLDGIMVGRNSPPENR